jgi:hypothetical protein
MLHYIRTNIYGPLETMDKSREHMYVYIYILLETIDSGLIREYKTLYI